MRRAHRVLFIAGAALIAVYFFRLVRPSLHVYFTPDDLMNLYRSWEFSPGALARANFLFFLNSPFFRPMGSLWYASVFHFSGFHPFWFHLTNLVILFVNIFLTYAVARRLSGSREVAAVATLAGCYAPHLAFLYFDTGYIYDVLCYCFYLSGFLLYIRTRQRAGRILRAWEIAACCALYVCALNSKEMAVTLPVILAVYEILYHPPVAWRAAPLRRWIVQEGRAALITGAITLLFLIGRVMSPGSLVSDQAYRPAFTLKQFILTSRHFAGDLVSGGPSWSGHAVWLSWAGMLAVAWAAKSRTLKFAWLYVMLTPLPVAFIFPRGASQYYIVWFGIVLYGATVLVRSLEYLTHKLWREGMWLDSVRGTAVLLGLVWLMYPSYKRLGWSHVASASMEAGENRDVVEQLHSIEPQFRSGSHLLFLNDPVRTDWENLIFMVRLSYRDNELFVDRAKRMPRAPDPQKMASYDRVFDYKGGRFFELKPPWLRTPTPMVMLDVGVPEIFHEHWVRVSAAQPATAGELLQARAVDLGATSPAIPSGQAFPQDPLLHVASAIQVRVNGQPAEVALQIGWPHEVNEYRVDFRVPENIRPGDATVEVTADGVTGPPVTIAVR